MNSTLTDEQRHDVQRQVDALLAKSSAFQALPSEEAEAIRRNMRSIADTMVDNRLAQAAGDPFAVPLADPPPIPGFPVGTQPGSTRSPQFTGGVQPNAPDAFGPKEIGDFGTGVATGVGQAGALLRQVNFPAFVAELIQGVFQAVVDASIQQMKAYGELVQSVAMSLSDFRDQNVTQNQARDHLVSKYPTLMQINVSDRGPTVGLRPEADEDDLPDFRNELGLSQDVTSLDDETIEELLVPAARNDLARSRQSLLATMVLMGINRIVVTDGRINAKLKFNFRAADQQVTHAQDYDYGNFGTTVAAQSSYESGSSTGENYQRSGWFSQKGESSRYTTGQFQRTETPAIYLTGIEDTQTSAELEASAKLAGEVNLNFRSETFDLNQLASADEIFRLERVRSAGRGVPAAASDGGSASTPPDQNAATTAPTP